MALIYSSAEYFDRTRATIEAILELSAKGCLLHSSAAPSPEGTRITFALPERGLVEATAEMRSRRDEDAGLFFREISESHRSAIAEYVNQVLMS